VSVPHCIAHQLRISGNEQDAAELPKKGAVGEGWVWIAPDLVDYSLTALVGRDWWEQSSILLTSCPGYGSSAHRH
jgi:hypothetical protein